MWNFPIGRLHVHRIGIPQSHSTPNGLSLTDLYAPLHYTASYSLRGRPSYSNIISILFHNYSLGISDRDINIENLMSKVPLNFMTVITY